MKKAFIFCIGGTGIRVMKSIIMMMAGGMDTNGYDIVPIIIDPHLDLDEKKRVDALISEYQYIHEKSINNGDEKAETLNGFFYANMLTLDDLQATTVAVQTEGSQDAFSKYISRSSLASDDINNFLVETLFSTKNLNSPLSVGFKGNPNVGTVVLGDIIARAPWWNIFLTHCEQGDKVFIISSIFGGTGASGFPLLEKKIKLADQHPNVKGADLAAVTVLPYYSLRNGETNGSDIDSANFYTKTKAALSYYYGNIKSDYLYYAGEQSLKSNYENDEEKQDDKANFIEMVAASALFDFLGRNKGNQQQFMTRAIIENKDSLDLNSMGSGFKPEIKNVADFMLLRMLVNILPKERHFPLTKNRGFNEAFYNDAEFGALQSFCEVYYEWYSELATNTRAFAPIKYDNPKDMIGWIKGMTIKAKNDSYFLLKMIQAGNKAKTKDNDNKLRLFLQFAYEAANHYTQKIFK